MNVLENEMRKQQKIITQDLYDSNQEAEVLRHTDMSEHTEQRQRAADARFFFADSYERRFGELATVKKPEITVTPGEAPDKTSRQKVKNQHIAQVAEHKRQLRVQAYFECQWKEHEDRLNDPQLENDPLNRFAVPELNFSKAGSDSPGELKRLSWIRTKFVAWENDPQANMVQQELAGVLTDTRDMLAKELSLETKNEAKIQALKTILTRMMVCTEGYAKNERELHKASNIHAKELFRSDNGLETDGIDAKKLRETAVSMSIDIRKETRQLLTDEIYKLAAFAISARDGVQLTNPADIAYLEKLGIQKDTFNSFEASNITVIAAQVTDDDFQVSVEELFKNVVINDAFLSRFEEFLENGSLTEEQQNTLLERLTREMEREIAANDSSTLAERAEVEREGIAARETSLIEQTDKSRAEALIQLRSDESAVRTERITETSAAGGAFTEKMTEIRKTINLKREQANESYFTTISNMRKELRLTPYLRAIRFAGNAERDDSGNLTDILEKWKNRIDGERLAALRTQLPDGRMKEPRALSAALIAFIPATEMALFKPIITRLEKEEIIEKDQMPLLLAATDFILTTDDETALLAELERVSGQAFESMKAELDAIQKPAQADGEYDYLADLGDRLSALRIRAHKAMTKERFDELDSAITEKMKTALPDFKSLLYGEDISEDDAPLLDRLLLAGNLHPGIANALKELPADKRSRLLAGITGADGVLAMKAIDELLTPYPELDDVCLALKSKILGGALRTGDNWEKAPQTAFQVQVNHSSGRVMRYLRGKLKLMVDGLPETDSRVAIVNQYDSLSDREFLEKLLSHKFSVDSFWDSRETLMYIRAYALILAGEKGSVPAIDELAQQECLSSYTKEVIENAMSAKLDTEEDYSSAIASIEKQSDVYDPTRFGNRALNFIGAVFDYDLSSERMTMRSLRGLVEPAGRYEARQLLIQELSRQFALNGMSSVESIPGAVAQGDKKTIFDLKPFAKQLINASAAAVQWVKNSELEAENLSKLQALTKEGQIIAPEQLEQTEAREWAEYEGPARQLSDARAKKKGDAKGAELALLVTALHIALKKAADAEGSAADASNEWNEINKITTVITTKFKAKFDLSTMTADSNMEDTESTLISEIGNMFKKPGERRAGDILTKYFDNQTKGDATIYGLGALSEAAIMMEFAQGTDMESMPGITKKEHVGIQSVEAEVKATVSRIHGVYTARDKSDGGSLLAAERQKRKERFGKSPDRDVVKQYTLSTQISCARLILSNVTADMNTIIANIGRTAAVAASENGASKTAALLAADKKLKYTIQAHGAVLQHIASSMDKMSNVLSMTVETDKKNEHAIKLTARLKTELAKVASQIKGLERRNAATFHTCLDTVTKLTAFMDELGLSERADACLSSCTDIIDQDQFIKKAITTSAVSLDANAVVTEKLQTEMKGKFAVMQAQREGTRDLGAVLLANDRVLYKTVKTTGEARISLTICAISAVLDSNMELAARKSLLNELQAKITNKTNLLTMTDEKSSVAKDSPPELIKRQLTALLKRAAASNTAAEFDQNVESLRELISFYKLKERAEIVMTEMAVSTQKRRAEDLKSVFGDKSSEIRTLISEQYENAAKTAAPVEAPKTAKLTEAERRAKLNVSMEQIDKERFREKALGKNDFYGATFALSILGLKHIIDTVGQAKQKKAAKAIERTEIAKQVGAVKACLRGKFNILAMLKKSNDSADSQTARLRELFLSLCDDIINAQDDDSMLLALKKLESFYIKYNLEDRAISALEAKESKYGHKELRGTAAATSTIKTGSEYRESTMESYGSEDVAAQAKAAAGGDVSTKKTRGSKAAAAKTKTAAGGDVSTKKSRGSLSFASKIKNAVGNDVSTQALRENLKQYESLIGTEGRLETNVSAQLGWGGMGHMMSITRSDMLELFSKNFSAPNFNAYFDELRKEDSVLRAELVNRLTADIHATKKTEEDGSSPLLNQKRSSALAKWLVGELVKEIAKAADANTWLTTRAQKHTATESRQVIILKWDQGAESAQALDTELKRLTIEDAVAGLKAGAAMSLNSYTKGGVSIEGSIAPDVTAGVSLEAAMSKDLTIERVGGDKELFHVYLSADYMGKVGASAGVDLLDAVHAGVTAGVSAGMAAGIRLDFDSMESCQQFVKGLFSVMENRVETEKTGVPSVSDASKSETSQSREMFKLASDVKLITSTMLGFEISGEVSAELTVQHVTSGLMEIESVRNAVSTVRNAIDDKLESAKQTVKSIMDSTINSVAVNLPGFMSEQADDLKSALQEETAEWANKVIEAITDKGVGAAEDKIKALAAELTEKLVARIKGEAEDADSEGKEEEKEEEEKAEISDKARELIKPQIEAMLTKLFTAPEQEEQEEEEEKEEKEEGGESFALIDASISAGFSASRKSETTRTGDGTKTVRTTTKMGAFAGFQAHLLGVDAYEANAAAEATVTLEQHYTGSSLTGAEMERNYSISAGNAGAVKMRKLLKSFGVSNESLISDISNMPDGEIPVVINAKLTQGGLRKYREALREKKLFLANFILADRRNYRINEISLEANISESSIGYDASLSVGTNKLPLAKAKVGLNIAFGTDGKRTQKYVYIPKPLSAS